VGWHSSGVLRGQNGIHPLMDRILLRMGGHVNATTGRVGIRRERRRTNGP